MSAFDQRNQHVVYQYNAVGDINFGAVRNKADVIGELKKLQSELASATERKALGAEAAIDAESALKKAVLQAGQPEPNKSALLAHLNNAKNLVSGVSGLVGAFGQAIDKVQALF